MSRRFLQSNYLAYGLNLGLVAGLGLLGCGEASQSPTDIESEPNGTVGTLHALIASYDDHSETLYRLRKDDGTDVGLYFGSGGTRIRVGERIAVRGERKGDMIEVTGHELVQRRIGDTQERRLSGG